MSKKKQKIWKAVADIVQNTCFMMDYPLRFFFEEWPKLGLGKKFNEYFTYFKGDFSQMVYVAWEFDDQTEFMAKKVIKKPVWAYGLLKKVEDYSTEFFREMKKVKKLPLSKMSNAEIIKFLKKVGKIHSWQHGLGAALSWHADAEGERVTKAVMAVIEERLKKSSVKKSLAEVFSLITTPLRESLIQTEEKSFLKVAQSISQQKKMKKVFIQSDLDELVNNLKGLDRRTYRKILTHYNKFAPLTYQYKGPAFPLSDYVGRWQALLRDGALPNKLLRELERESQKLKKEQQKLIKSLNFTFQESNLIKVAQYMMFIKDYRKNALYNAMYYYEFIFKEIGKRLHLSVGQIQAMGFKEIVQALQSGKVNTDELNQRQKEAVAYWVRKPQGVKDKILVGKEMKNFLKKIVWQKINTESDELKGTCAYPGKVTGIVKIINTPDQMNKMENGNIMVAHNTNPNLVPAMKKATAIIGGAGGLTCHSAIVAREMRIPCVVGVANCDRILKDGDKVEVDADKGVIRKI